MPYSTSYPIPQDMLDTITACTTGLGGIGVVGGLIGPGGDLVVIAPVWVGMVIRLANQAGASMDEQTAQKLLMAIATGAGMFVTGTKIASTVFSWLLALPTLGMSLLANAAANAALNACLTRAFGRAVALYFLQTHKMETTEVAAKVMIALAGIQLGIPSSHPDIVS